MGHGSLFGAGAGSLHLQAIAALKQLCNHPALLANKIKTASVKEQQVTTVLDGNQRNLTL